MYCQDKYLYILCFQIKFYLRSYRWYYMYITTELVLVTVILMALKYLLHYTTIHLCGLYIYIHDWFHTHLSAAPDSSWLSFSSLCVLYCKMPFASTWTHLMTCASHSLPQLLESYIHIASSFCLFLVLLLFTWVSTLSLRWKTTFFVLRVPGAQWQCCQMGGGGMGAIETEEKGHNELIMRRVRTNYQMSVPFAGNVLCSQSVHLYGYSKTEFWSTLLATVIYVD